MREVTEEALRRLYWASRRRTGFPGTVPDESEGAVTIEGILQGLGLVFSTHQTTSSLKVPYSPTLAKGGLLEHRSD